MTRRVATTLALTVALAACASRGPTRPVGAATDDPSALVPIYVRGADAKLPV